MMPLRRNSHSFHVYASTRFVGTGCVSDWVPELFDTNTFEYLRDRSALQIIKIAIDKYTTFNNCFDFHQSGASIESTYSVMLVTSYASASIFNKMINSGQRRAIVTAFFTKLPGSLGNSIAALRDANMKVIDFQANIPKLGLASRSIPEPRTSE